MALARPISRLAPRIYLFSLVQTVLVLATLLYLLNLEDRPPFRFADTMRFIGMLVSEGEADPPALARLVANLRATLNASTAIYDEAGDLVACDPGTQAPRRYAELQDEVVEGAHAIVVPARGTWRLVFLESPRIPLPETLVVFLLTAAAAVAASSVWFARWLGRPLAQLAKAAQGFGAGRLNARVQMQRSDEFGDVALAFNKMAERLAQALRVERELLANVSHELRTPLQRIHIALELAVEGDAADVRSLLGDIAQDLAELGRVLDDVMTAARLSAGDTPSAYALQLPIRVELCQLEILIRKSEERFRANHPTRALELSFHGDIPALAVDGMLIRRAIDNLLENAHKYTDEPGAPIALSTRTSDEAVIVEVRDQGIGIAAVDLQRISEPFFRTDRSRNRETGGTGLGLTLTRRILEVHGGTLTLESTLGEGTCARIELPLRRRAT